MPEIFFSTTPSTSTFFHETSTITPIMMTSESPINISSSPPASNLSDLPNCMMGIFTEDQTSYRLYANLPISIGGIILNVLNIMVFYDREMRTLLMNHFLMALSISDLLLLIFNFFFLLFPVMAVNSKSFFMHDVFPLVLRYSYPLALTTQTCGVYLTVVVSVHRFLGVCYPFRTKRWVTRKPVHYAIAGCVLFSVGVNIPTWMELDIEPCYSEMFHVTSRQIILTHLQSEPMYHLIKRVILYTAIMFIIPFLMLILVNCQIIGALRRSTKLRKDHTTLHSLHSTKFESNHEKMLKQFRLLKRTKYTEVFQNLSKLSNATIFKPPTEMFKKKFTNSTRDRSVTLMLLAIVGIFLGCNGLAFCNNIIEITWADKMSPEGMVLFEKVVEISNTLITVNSSTSTLVYLIFSSKYRKVLKNLLKFRRTKKVNRIALTTAVAAHRAVELSLIPDEAASEHRRDQWQILGRKFFRRSNTQQQSIIHSESFMRLTITDETSLPPLSPLSPNDIKSNRSSRNPSICSRSSV